MNDNQTQERLFCAYCGSWGNHTSGGCKDLDLDKLLKENSDLRKRLEDSESARIKAEGQVAEMRYCLKWMIEDYDEGDNSSESIARSKHAIDFPITDTEKRLEATDEIKKSWDGINKMWEDYRQAKREV